MIMCAAMPHARRKLVTIVGTRPQFIKAFALSRVLKDDRDFEEILVHTGQHFDANMSSIFFSELDIAPPHYHFAVNSTSHGAMTGEMLQAIEHVLIAEKPSAAIVYGDTNSTLAGALAAAKLQIPLIHIEAGLRSFNKGMPEEINRVVTDHVSDILFCPTRVAAANLEREGIDRGVNLVGDLMYDATLIATPIAERSSTILDDLKLSPRRYGVATIHRAANTDDAAMLSRLFDYWAGQAREMTMILSIPPRQSERGLTRLGPAFALSSHLVIWTCASSSITRASCSRIRGDCKRKPIFTAFPV